MHLAIREKMQSNQNVKNHCRIELLKLLYSFVVLPQPHLYYKINFFHFLHGLEDLFN